MTPANDAPTLSVPAAQNAAEDTNLIFSSAGGNAISLSDVDAGANPVQLTLSVANGVLSLAGSAGLSFTIGTGTGDATMTFTGSLASINAALDGLAYTGNPNYNGADSLALQINDLGNSGAGGPLVANQTLAINVSAVHDAPTLAIPAAQSIAEDTPLVFSAANVNAFNIIDIDGTNGLVQLTLNANNGTLTLARTTNLLLLAGTGFADTSVTIQGRITDVNAALDGLILMPASNFSGALPLTCCSKT